VGRKRTCELPFCKGVVEGTRNKRRCDNDRNIHLHQIISKNVKRIMKLIEGADIFTANDVNKALFKNKLDKNEKGSMYRLFQAMVREGYILEKGKTDGLKAYAVCDEVKAKRAKKAKAKTMVTQTVAQEEAPKTIKSTTETKGKVANKAENKEKEAVRQPKVEARVAPKTAAPAKSAKQNPEEVLLSKLRAFVYDKHGQWNHHDWEELINRSDIKEFGLSSEDIGKILEEEKKDYWKERNG
jgi:hypothetical protein